LSIDEVRLERADIVETGEYDLEGLFIRLGYAIDSIGAKRVALDTIEALFAGLTDSGVLRAELRRLFRWLKTKGVTAIVTAERGQAGLTPHGLEEYVADCVILLDSRVIGELATRRLRVVKYRGSAHGTNEYPYLIDEGGISILPVTSMRIDYEASTEHVSSGVPLLDAMLGGEGYYRASSVLISGTAGTGKTSLAAHFAQASAQRGERCLWFAFEESLSQIVRNMRSIGVDLAPAVERGVLRVHSERPTMFGLEMHLLMIRRLVDEFQPRSVIIDPISNFAMVGDAVEVKVLLMRLVDFFKTRGITSLFTNLMTGEMQEKTQAGVASLIDTWLLLRDIEIGAERNRALYLLKSRGMAHSNQVREFLLTDHGVELQDAYVGKSGGLLMGSALMVQRAQDEAHAVAAAQKTDLLRRNLELRQQAVEAQIAVLRAQLELERTTALSEIARDDERSAVLEDDRARMASHRHAVDPDVRGTETPETGGST